MSSCGANSMVELGKAGTKTHSLYLFLTLPSVYDNSEIIYPFMIHRPTIMQLAAMVQLY